MIKRIWILVLVGVFAGCSGAQKVRREERERAAQASGLYCDFVSESDFKDVDIELNLRLAKRCDGTKPFSISGYKRVSENPGVLYCCNIETEKDVVPTKPVSTPAVTKP